MCFIQAVHCQISQTISSAHAAASQINQLVLDLGEGNVEVRKTMGSRVMIETTVKAAVPNDRLLGFLVEQGRYELASNIDDTNGILRINNRKNNSVLMVKGQPCQETISYIIYIPAHIQFVKNQLGEKLYGGDNNPLTFKK